MFVPPDLPDWRSIAERMEALEVRMTAAEAESVRLAADLATCRAINVLDAELLSIRDRMSDDGIGGGE